MRALWVVGWVLCSGCVGSVDVEELDSQQRSLDARTVVLEPGFTLWSPFTLAQTKEWVALVDEELTASRALFAVSSEQRTLVVLVPTAGFGPNMELVGDSHVLTAPARHPLNGLNALATRYRVILYVTPDRELPADDARLVTAHRSAGNYRPTLRHELAHVNAFAVGLIGEDWFSEGVAHWIESFELEQGVLVDRGPRARELQAARALPVESLSVARLLAWREECSRVASGAEPVDEVSRTVCGLFMRFLVERGPQGSLVERLRAVDGQTRGELEALDAEWRAWLAAADDAPTAQGVDSRRSRTE
jgi:hypothetical protein